MVDYCFRDIVMLWEKICSPFVGNVHMIKSTCHRNKPSQALTSTSISFWIWYSYLSMTIQCLIFLTFNEIEAEWEKDGRKAGKILMMALAEIYVSTWRKSYDGWSLELKSMLIRSCTVSNTQMVDFIYGLTALSHFVYHQILAILRIEFVMSWIMDIVLL